MAKDYVVSNAFIAKDKQGNIKSFESQYGTLVSWNVYFEGDDTKWQMNKKEGAEINKGDVLYGHTEIVERGGYKFPTFKSEQRPMGTLPQLPKPAPVVENLDNEKLDYIIGLLENIAKVTGANDVVVDDIDDGPIDLSAIPF